MELVVLEVKVVYVLNLKPRILLHGIMILLSAEVAVELFLEAEVDFDDVSNESELEV